jgi:DNA modification methylase
MNPRLIHGDSREELRRLIDARVRVHSVVTDPPYALSIVKRFGKEGAAPAKFGRDGAFARASRGFMGKEWDTGEVAFDPEFWRLIHEILLPGGFVCAFSSPRTGHRQAVAMEDAGLIMHPFIGWTYSSGMPKAHSVSRSIGAAGDGAAWTGWSYGLQALKPALEPIYVAQRPFSERTGGLNVLAHGVGGMNIDACRVSGKPWKPLIATGLASKKFFSEGEAKKVLKEPHALGRWPANLLHDGSQEVSAALGSAAEHFSIFHHGKANKTDRAGSNHPTVKPIALIQFLVRLVTPNGGTVLDPFAGSGTTGEAAKREGARCILIERESEYAADIRRRFAMRSAIPADCIDLIGLSADAEELV